MRKIIAGFAVSLDGYLEGAKGEYEWMMANPDPDYDYTDAARRFDTFLIGRKTYEKILALNDTSFKQYNNYVFSKTLNTTADSFTLVSGDTVDFINNLKAKPGKEIALYGGAELLASFLDLNLLDEISMSVVPILLGSGKPMVSVLKRWVWLSLKGTKSFSNGNIELTYEVNK